VLFCASKTVRPEGLERLGDTVPLLAETLPGVGHHALSATGSRADVGMPAFERHAYTAGIMPAAATLTFRHRGSWALHLSLGAALGLLRPACPMPIGRSRTQQCAA